MEKIQKIELRKFGLLLGTLTILLLGFVLPRIHHTLFSYQFITLGFSLMVAGLLSPQLLKPVNTIWQFLGHILGWINTRIILGLLYFFIITPISILKRIFGTSALLRPDKKLATYRINSINHPPKQMEKPF